MKSFLFLSYVARTGKTIYIIITEDVSILVHLSSWTFSNRPFPSSLGPLFQNEARCSAFDMEMIFHSHANKTHFHKKGCAPSLVLKVRVFGTRKWHISLSQTFFKGWNMDIFQWEKFPSWKRSRYNLELNRNLVFYWNSGIHNVTKALTNGFLDDWYSTFNPKFCLFELGVKPLRSPQPELLD